jgi:hypothetical protein
VVDADVKLAILEAAGAGEPLAAAGRVVHVDDRPDRLLQRESLGQLAQGARADHEADLAAALRASRQARGSR